jgi:LuxR family maltose regulon positive regulatory protein
VPRPSLTGRLLGGSESKLTLISAPAGFGKSTLLAEWLAVPTDGSVTAWLSLDAGDDHPSTFWPHLIAALQTAQPGIGAKSLSLLESPDRSIEAVLAPLLNELDALTHDIVLVLDDYHVIDSSGIQIGMSFVLDHLPARVRLVIATRIDPALPLARLRARGQLIEIRAADLRFTPDEAVAYFNGVMDLGLTTADVEALEGRTEGWIAALQLAGLSMQGRDDVAGFIAGFAGDDRYIVDYLVEEVLQLQSERVHTFLLETSILSRLNGPLSDAVTGQGGGKAMLEALERQNLLVIPLDDRRDWYRYHHLFADVLQARLRDDRPERVAELHRRATEWYEQVGERAEAIRHAMAGKDFARAADLVELAMPETSRDRQDATLRRWLEALPEEVIRARPVLSNGYAGSILVRGETAGVEARLQDAERWLESEDGAPTPDGAPGSSMVVVDQDAVRTLPARIAMHRAGLARLEGDVDGTIAHARRVLDLVGDDDDLGIGSGSTLLGLAYWTRGDLEAASDLYVGAMAHFEKAGYRSDAIGLALALADIQITQGRLHDAMRTYERGLELAAGGAAVVLRGAADMHVGISEILRERDDLIGATQHLRQARDLGDENGLPQNPYRSRVAAAGIRRAEGAFEAATELLAEAGRLYFSDFSPQVRPVDALEARLWLNQGRLPEALGWAREKGLSAADDLTYVREFEHATVARVLVAQGIHEGADKTVRAAIDLTEKLLVAADAGRRDGSAIDILIAQALARRAYNDPEGAKTALDRAVAIAEPEGYVRIFIDEGPPMTTLLKAAAKDRHASAYVRRLLAATAVAGPTDAAVAQPLLEPLSERELDVLRLLESDLDGPDIAQTLTVSLPTVRTHTSNIYSKLGVTNRRAAVSRAAELGLLSRSTDRRPTR